MKLRKSSFNVQQRFFIFFAAVFSALATFAPTAHAHTSESFFIAIGFFLGVVLIGVAGILALIGRLGPARMMAIASLVLLAVTGTALGFVLLRNHASVEPGKELEKMPSERDQTGRQHASLST